MIQLSGTCGVEDFGLRDSGDPAVGKRGVEELDLSYNHEPDRPGRRQGDRHLLCAVRPSLTQCDVRLRTTINIVGEGAVETES